MPIYEFKCDVCEICEEKNVSFKDYQVPNCHKCSQPMRKLVSMPASPKLIGGGFYKTDYKDRSSDVL